MLIVDNIRFFKKGSHLDCRHILSATVQRQAAIDPARPARPALAILVPALFVGFFVHVTCIVSYTVIGTSGLPNEEQGLATGLASMTQQVAVSIGAPIMAAIAATQSVELTGVHLALGVNVAVTLLSVVLIWFGLRPRGGSDDSQVASTPASKGTAEGQPV